MVAEAFTFAPAFMLYKRLYNSSTKWLICTKCLHCTSESADVGLSKGSSWKIALIHRKVDYRSKNLARRGRNTWMLLQLSVWTHCWHISSNCGVQEDCWIHSAALPIMAREWPITEVIEDNPWKTIYNLSQITSWIKKKKNIYYVTALSDLIIDSSSSVIWDY